MPESSQTPGSLPKDWIAQLAKLHERVRAGTLEPADRPRYLDYRERLSNALLRQQNQSLPPGAKPRLTLRVPVSLPITIVMPSWSESAVTVDISLGGFSALVPRKAVAFGQLDFHLVLVAGLPALKGTAQIVSCRWLGGSSHLAAAFDPLPPEERERIELLIFDFVLARVDHLTALRETH